MTTYESFRALTKPSGAASLAYALGLRGDADSDSDGKGKIEEPEDAGLLRRKSSSKHFWMDDTAAKSCFNCEAPFTLFRRKHHCRSCGAIYCDKCSSKTADGGLYGYSGQVRVCDACFESANQVQRGIGRKKRLSLHFNSSSSSASYDDSQGPQVDKGQVKENEPLDLGIDERDRQNIDYLEDPVDHNIGISGSTRRSRRISREPTDLVEALETQNPMILPPRSKDDMDGPDEWTLNKQAMSSFVFRQRSNSLEDGFAKVTQSEFDKRSKSLRRVGSNSDLLDFDVQEAIESLKKEYEKRSSLEKGDTDVVVDAQRDLFARRLDKGMDRFVLREVSALRDQRPSIILSEQGQMMWMEKLSEISREFCSMVRPFNMDFDSYCKLVSIPGGSISESFVLNGVICEKNVVHKRMRRRIENPRIMIVEGAIEFLRDKSRISSLDTLREQEVQYMQLVVRKIASVGVDLLLVGNPVSRIAQQLLLEENISLVINMPKKLLERIAVQTGALILPGTGNITQQSDPRGTCELWELRSFSTELSEPQKQEQLERTSARNEKQNAAMTLMFFEGCIPRQGASICLRGGSPATLRQIEKILTKMVSMTYTIQQQHALFFDIGVMFGEDKFSHPRSVAIEDELLATEKIEFSRIVLTEKDAMHQAERKVFHFGTTGSDLSLGEYLRRRCFDRVRPTSATPTGSFVRSSAAGIHSTVFSDKITEHASPKVSGKGLDGSGMLHIAPPTGLGVTSSTLLQAVTRQDDDTNESYAGENRRQCTVYEIGDARVFMFCGSLSRVDNVQGSLRDMLMNARREYVAKSIRRLLTCNARANATLALPIKSHVILTWSECLKCPATTNYRILTKDAESLSFARWLQLKFHFKGKNVATFFSDAESVCKHSIFQDYVTYFECMGQVVGFELEYFPRYTTSIETGDYVTPVAINSAAEKWMDITLKRRKETIQVMWTILEKYLLQERLLVYQEQYFGGGPIADQLVGLIESIQSTKQYHDDILSSDCSLLQLNRVRRELLVLVEEWNESLEAMREKVSVTISRPHRPISPAQGAKALTDLFENPDAAQNGPEPISLFPDFDLDATFSPPVEVDQESVESGLSKQQLSTRTEPANSVSSKGRSESVEYLTEFLMMEGDPDLSSESTLPLPPPLFPDRSSSDPKSLFSSGEKRMTKQRSASDEPVCASELEETTSTSPMSNGRSLARSQSSGAAQGIDTHKVEFDTLLQDVETKCALLHPFVFPDRFVNRGHPLLPAGFGNRVVFVYDDEPTSWIAFALNSKDHRQKLFAQAEELGLIESFQGEDWPSVLRYPIEHKSSAIELEFQGNSKVSPAFQFSVKVYSPLHFYALRNAFWHGSLSSGERPECEVAFLESLSRCTSWNATGGKSKSLFFKTKDGQYVAKSITSEELEMFMTISQGYFSHLANVREKALPTALMRIVGVFTVTTKVANFPAMSASSTPTASSSAGVSTFPTPVAMTSPTSASYQAQSQQFVQPFDLNTAVEDKGTRKLSIVEDAPDLEEDESVENVTTSLPVSAAPMSPPLSPKPKNLRRDVLVSEAASGSRPGTPQDSSFGSTANTLSPQSSQGGKPTRPQKVAPTVTSGFYRTSSVDSAQVRTVKTHFIILSNLFQLGEKFDARFDLKGNLRNRLVANPKENEVLMDRNFQMYTNGFPIPLMEESKATLMAALESDTAFLEQEDLVDYSLLVGIPSFEDSENEVPEGQSGERKDDTASQSNGKNSAMSDDPQEIRMGLIDFLQLYNVKKMIESSVKRAGMIAGQLEPTVIDPSGYRTRFLRAVDRYFVGVPGSPLEQEELSEKLGLNSWQSVDTSAVDLG